VRLIPITFGEPHERPTRETRPCIASASSGLPKAGRHALEGFLHLDCLLGPALGVSIPSQDYACY
jgi:hypothetical protein